MAVMIIAFIVMWAVFIAWTYMFFQDLRRERQYRYERMKEAYRECLKELSK